MNNYVLGFKEIDKSKLTVAGGKGANLGELSRIEGINVPEGFCISTAAFRKLIGEIPAIGGLLDQLSLLKPEDRENISRLSGELRNVIEGAAIPGDIIEAITAYLSGYDENTAYAIRSSATAEDLPTASFAGQQDTYLNIMGTEAILKHIGRCWASLFTERAIIYRLQKGFDHRKVCLAVVVQRMVFPVAAGIMFTADPVTSNRKVLSVDAGFGLGEALVSGLVNSDVYKVRNGCITDKLIPVKKLTVNALKGGGTKEQELGFDRQNMQVLTDEQILQLEHIGRRIEDHFGCPQDIEWCLADDTFHIVQSRPITALYPIPEAKDKEKHVYVSVAHQQMMTDPMKPLGISIFQLSAAGPMFKAGGRLFVDVAHMLASPDSRGLLLDNMGQHDPLIKDALITIIERGDFANPLSEEKREIGGKSSKAASPQGFRAQTENENAIVSELIERCQISIQELKQNIQNKSGCELFDFILEDIQQLKKLLFDRQSMGVIMAAMDASAWLNKKILEWLGEKGIADTLTQSVAGNITSEMGLALMEVADVIRPYPEIINYLQQMKDDDFLDGILDFAGGREARDAVNAFLEKYGMRCTGEIDITKARWSEKPAVLIPLILSNVKNLEPDAGKHKFEQGRQEAMKKEYELLERLMQLPDGEQKARETKRMIDLVRNFTGYREYPKYVIVNRYFIYKQALLREAEKLVRTNIIDKKEDIYYLTFEELRRAVCSSMPDYPGFLAGEQAALEIRRIISKARAEYGEFEKLTPPRVITSDGEIVAGRYKRENIPRGAIAGLAVSSGIIEGRARVIINMEAAELEAGDILVTSFTDPSWTPLFVSVKGLVTEVGGLMTHGAVIAREYGLPAVVGVENATKMIKDGQRIRVNGTEGYVEIL